MKEFIYSKLGITILLILSIIIISLITIITPEPYTFIPPVILSIACGIGIKYWINEFIKYKSNN